MVLIVLDSTEIDKDLGLQDPVFSALQSFLYDEANRLVVPEIVVLEVLSHIGETLHELDRTERSLAKLTGIPLLEWNLESAGSRAEDHLRSRIEGVGGVVRGEIAVGHIEVVRRMAERKRPFSGDSGDKAQNREKGYKDFLIWRTALEAAREYGQGLAFVSRDRAFFQGEGLHPDLEADAADLGVDARLFDGLGSLVTEVIKPSLNTERSVQLRAARDENLQMLSGWLRAQGERLSGLPLDLDDDDRDDFDDLRFVNVDEVNLYGATDARRLDDTNSLITVQGYVVSTAPALVTKDQLDRVRDRYDDTDLVDGDHDRFHASLLIPVEVDAVFDLVVASDTLSPQSFSLRRAKPDL